MADYASNSNKSEGKTAKAPEKSVERVTSGLVVKRKKPLGRRFKDVFINGDFGGAVKYIANDVLVPALRNLFVDASTKGIERVIYGERAVQPRGRSAQGSRVSYNRPVQRQPMRPERGVVPDQPPRYRQNRHEAQDIILSSRPEAELVLERLIDILEKYEVASLADLYDLVGLPTSHVDNKWGWVNLSGVSVLQVRDGFIIDLPPVEAY
jgi:hypothetical protein